MLKLRLKKPRKKEGTRGRWIKVKCGYCGVRYYDYYSQFEFEYDKLYLKRKKSRLK